MTHTWRTAGRMVLHSTQGGRVDAVGVGLGEDTLGPFPSDKLAATVADALSNAYQAGRTEVTAHGPAEGPARPE